MKPESTTNTIFNASVAGHYDKYSGPVFFEPYALEIAARIDPSNVDTAVEIACGTGRVTNHLRSRLKPSAKLVATDISQDMLEVAKEKLHDQLVEWQVVDAQNLPFEDSSIDLIVCAFGYMFLPDKVTGFAAAYRVLRPGGKLLFTTWDRLEFNGASLVHRKIVQPVLGEDLPPTFHIPFSMNNDEDIANWLQQAGFSNFKIERVDKTAKADSTKQVAEGLTQGGTIYNELMKRSPDQVPRIRAEVETQLVQKFGDAPMMAPMRALFVTAIKDN
jgi:ubiquinone/menaquinone biosynthesis C-methylase UbiE